MALTVAGGDAVADAVVIGELFLPFSIVDLSGGPEIERDYLVTGTQSLSAKEIHSRYFAGA